MCRAVDLATGALDRFFHLVSATLISQLTDAADAAQLSAVQRGQLVDFFNIGKQYIYVELVLRIDRGWSSLPLRALGMGSEFPDVSAHVPNLIHIYGGVLFAWGHGHHCVCIPPQPPQGTPGSP